MIDGPLNPDTALFREGDVLLQEDPGIVDRGSYHGVLSAISRGAHRRSEIAAVLGKPDAALSHPLGVLERLRLLDRIDDAFRDRRPVYRIAEPILRLHELVVGPHEAALVAGLGHQVWRQRADTVASKIYGPHFEDLARDWCRYHAATETLGGDAGRVQPATVACREHRAGHEVDVVVTQVSPGRSDRVVAIGEAKSSRDPVGEGVLRRLEHLRELVPARLVGGAIRLLVFGRGGFSFDLTQEASQRGDVELIDLDRLYRAP